LIPAVKCIDEDPLSWTLTHAVQAIRSQAISSEALTGICLDRIDQLQPMLNAFISVDRDGALAAARDADRRLRAVKSRCRRGHSGVNFLPSRTPTPFGWSCRLLVIGSSPSLCS